MSPTPKDRDKRDAGEARRTTDERRSTEERNTGATRPSRERTPRTSQSRSESAFSKEFSEAIGRTIKVIRTDLGIERKELAEQVGISYSYLTEIENGNKPASSTVLRPVAHALGMRLSQLTEAAERRIESYAAQHSLAPDMGAPDELVMEDGVDSLVASRDYRLMARASAPMRPSLRGQYHDLRAAILELESLLERMAPDDIERLLDYARRLSR